MASVEQRVRMALVQAVLCDPTDPANPCPIATTAEAIRQYLLGRGRNVDVEAASDIGDLTEAVACEFLLGDGGPVRAANATQDDDSLCVGAGDGGLFRSAGVAKLLASHGHRAVPEPVLWQAASVCNDVLDAVTEGLASCLTVEPWTRPSVRMMRTQCTDHVVHAVLTAGLAG